MVRRPILPAACPDAVPGGPGDGAATAGRTEGPVIPGLAASPAFDLTLRHPSEIPVLIAVPHAGRSYPPALVERMRHPSLAALRLEDRQVDALARAVAAATGASLLVAHAPRAMIDLNRAADDIDWDMVTATGPSASLSATPRPSPSRRVRSGLGLVPRRLPGVGELWRRRIDADDLARRIAQVHEPYHAALAGELARLRSRWGVALLIDLHSMPPLEPAGGQPGPTFVLGDRFGSTCSGALIASAFEWFGRAGAAAAHNRPYAGGYVLERHADPAQGLHGFQLEIDRARYLDSRLAELGPGFEPMVRLLTGLVTRLAEDVAALRGTDRTDRWREAAE
ncbi:N-formylglutamate amidohydrolase [Novosphingobium flavum]|uniref:N-formylglutamate amidohydrolase n=1 Tax=Novosphingobium aerophilum TaxID=2839843 RepID=A0A7X1KBD6_9SPHN|nr:N-formylglutamate amidohydrolase [Novosphingobium aerophilum]MBC2651093.1 N-formylglutamate amidohydrolase [Novosphingobium aerophilum]MBC2662634.1 N-formylglutamate amidohydrolase [Novosphingobium aerophilum]